MRQTRIPANTRCSRVRTFSNKVCFWSARDEVEVGRISTTSQTVIACSWIWWWGAINSLAFRAHWHSVDLRQDSVDSVFTRASVGPAACFSGGRCRERSTTCSFGDWHFDIAVRDLAILVLISHALSFQRRGFETRTLTLSHWGLRRRLAFDCVSTCLNLSSCSLFLFGPLLVVVQRWPSFHGSLWAPDRLKNWSITPGSISVDGVRTPVGGLLHVVYSPCSRSSWSTTSTVRWRLVVRVIRALLGRRHKLWSRQLFASNFGWCGPQPCGGGGHATRHRCRWNHSLSWILHGRDAEGCFVEFVGHHVFQPRVRHRLQCHEQCRTHRCRRRWTHRSSRHFRPRVWSCCLSQTFFPDWRAQCDIKSFGHWACREEFGFAQPFKGLIINPFLHTVFQSGLPIKTLYAELWCSFSRATREVSHMNSKWPVYFHCVKLNGWRISQMRKWRKGTTRSFPLDSEWSVLCQTSYDGVGLKDRKSMYNTLREF